MNTLALIMLICGVHHGAMNATSVRADQPARQDLNANAEVARFNHALWDAVLKKHVDDRGMVDYAGISNARKFREYLKILEKTPAENLIDDRDRLAFWINAYNALTVEAVLQTLPTDRSNWHNYHITKQKVNGDSIWKGIRFIVGGGNWTLDEIEHEILRKQDGLRDPRIHVALVCAARGCPPLWNRAYTGDAVDVQLVAAMNRFVANSNQCAFDLERRKIKISKIFKWYGADFVSDKFTPHAASIPVFLSNYITDVKLAHALRTGHWNVTYLEYDWKLNLKP